MRWAFNMSTHSRSQSLYYSAVHKIARAMWGDKYFSTNIYSDLWTFYTGFEKTLNPYHVHSHIPESLSIVILKNIYISKEGELKLELVSVHAVSKHP